MRTASRTTGRPRFAAAALALVGAIALAGCTSQTGGATDVDTANRSGQEVTSPSGDHTGTLVDGPEQDGVATLVVVVTGADGEEVFRTSDAYSTRHGVAIAWQSDDDVLWVLSSDVGTSRIEEAPSGWEQTWLTPETRDDVPPEIAALR